MFEVGHEVVRRQSTREGEGSAREGRGEGVHEGWEGRRRSCVGSGTRWRGLSIQGATEGDARKEALRQGQGEGESWSWSSKP